MKEIPHLDHAAQVPEEIGHEEARLRVLHLAVDSTGFSPTCASTYYVRRLKGRDGKPGLPRNRHEMSHYLMQTVAAKFMAGLAVDSPDFARMLKKLEPAKQPLHVVVTDKGYDVGKNHSVW